MFLVKSQFLHQGWSNSVLLEVVFHCNSFRKLVLYAGKLPARNGPYKYYTTQSSNLPNNKRKKFVNKTYAPGKPSGESEGKGEFASSIGVTAPSPTAARAARGRQSCRTYQVKEYSPQSSVYSQTFYISPAKRGGAGCRPARAGAITGEVRRNAGGTAPEIHPKNTEKLTLASKRKIKPFSPRPKASR